MSLLHVQNKVYGCRSVAAMAEPSQRPATINNVKPEAAITVFELLMMGDVSPETF